MYSSTQIPDSTAMLHRGFIVASLLTEKFDKGSTFHWLVRQSHKSQWPVGSIGASDIIACSEAIDESKVLAHTLVYLLSVDDALVVDLDSKHLFDSPSTQQNSIDKSIREDISAIRYKLKMHHVREFI